MGYRNTIGVLITRGGFAVTNIYNLCDGIISILHTENGIPTEKRSFNESVVSNWFNTPWTQSVVMTPEVGNIAKATKGFIEEHGLQTGSVVFFTDNGYELHDMENCFV